MLMRIDFCALLLLGVLSCSASAQEASWQSLGAKDTFAEAKLSATELREVIRLVEEFAFETPDSWIKELRVRRVDLGASEGLVLQGTNLLCGGTGNCQVFVLRKADKNWIYMFGREQAPLGEGFRFGPLKTNGIKNFSITANSSAGDSKRIVYKFDGQLYRPH